MNRSVSICLFTLAVLLSFSACKKEETEPKDWILDDLVWDEMDKNATIAQWVLNDAYNYMPTGFNRIGSNTGDYLDCAAGDAVPSRFNRPIEAYTNGRVSVINNPDPYWGSSYAGIRRSNIFLKNIDKVPAPALTIRYWKAEARFLRALFYFELMKRYGGVPLIGDTLFKPSDNLQLPRNTFAECADYIVKECDAVKDSLRPESALTDTDWGRVPKGAAIALKLRVHLYSASPLFNGGGIETDPVKKALTGYPTYDATRWQAVIADYEELKALNFYELNASFINVFITKRNKEVILAKQSPNGASVETNNAPMGYGTPALSNGLTSPTQELVDAYPMANGLGITEAGSGYNASAPYTGRDPRLGFTVFFNGMQWLKRPVETWEGGRDKPGGVSVQTRTGYYARKFMPNLATNDTYGSQSHNFILFRFAEARLAYAEALNEVNRVEDAVKEVIEIRKRAGITAGTGARYGIKAGITQAEMRNFIMNERRIELAFEEQRFWDLRRWKTAGTELNRTATGMKITRQPNGTFVYERVPVTTFTFQNRLYHMPIPYDETTKNLKLIQNEGW